MKAHLLSVEFPIKSGLTQTANCGATVKDAITLFIWDEQAMGEGLTYGKNVCQKCQLADKGPRQKMLVYGIAAKV